MSKETFHVGKPNLGDRESFIQRVHDMFDRNWLTNRGPFVREFEVIMADYFKVKHFIAMCNGTIALEIAIRALGLKGEVILPSMTFIATAHSLQWQGITPVFCDIDEESLCLDPSQIERHITPRTTGIIGVHLFSRPCAIDKLQQIADQYQFKLIFDAAHAFGCSYNNRMIGNFGDCEVFSFHATKFFNTFEGGAITTDDDALAEKIRLMQNFGFSGMDNVIYLGTNGKMSEICAAMGLTNFDSIERFLSVNKRNYDHYTKCISEIPGLSIVTYNEENKCNWQYIIVKIKEDFPLDRDTLMYKLHKANIRVRRYFWPGCHRMEPYLSHYPHAGQMLPVTEKVSKQLLAFPTGTAVNEKTIDSIVSLIRGWIDL